MSESSLSPRSPSARYASLINRIDRRFASFELPAFTLEFPDAAVCNFGTGEPAFTMKVSDDEGLRALGTLDELQIAQAYLNSHLDIGSGIMSLLEFRAHLTDSHPLLSFWRYVRPWIYGRPRQNQDLVPRHYDENPAFYLSFLDKRHRLYSQALFREAGDTLEDAASNKLNYIAQVCGVKAYTRVLDIGAGWGSFAEHAMVLGAEVTMLTLSVTQATYLRGCVQLQGATESQVVVEDIYTFAAPSQYDVVVMLGSMEHLPDYQALVARLQQMVVPGGTLYMDFSAVTKKYDIGTFTYHHVFEGDGTPVHLPELMDALNRSDFELMEMHNDRHSYYLTVLNWARRLESNHKDLVSAFGERAYRQFRLYLWATAHALGHSGSLEAYRLVARKVRGASSVTSHPR